MLKKLMFLFHLTKPLCGFLIAKINLSQVNNIPYMFVYLFYRMFKLFELNNKLPDVLKNIL